MSYYQEIVWLQRMGAVSRKGELRTMDFTEASMNSGKNEEIMPGEIKPGVSEPVLPGPVGVLKELGQTAVPTGSRIFSA